MMQANRQKIYGLMRLPIFAVASLVVSLGTCLSAEDSTDLEESATSTSLQRAVVATDRVGVIGDSMSAGTSADDSCGKGQELMPCIENRVGSHDIEWSHTGGKHPWSIAGRLGYDYTQVINAADDWERWTNALPQAQAIFAQSTQVKDVIISMGSNDVCRDYGHTFDQAQLDQIGADIDATFEYLTSQLPASTGRIFISGVPSLVNFRNLMKNRDHNMLYTSCGDLWNLTTDPGYMHEEAKQSLCAYYLGGLCTVLDEFVDQAVQAYMAKLLQDNAIDKGPCGAVLDSRNTQAQLDAAAWFNAELNALIGQKAAQWSGANGIEIRFTDNVFRVELKPYYVSQFDCFHPNRAGQMALAQTIWEGLHAPFAADARHLYDAMDSADSCTQEFTTWPSCWVKGGSTGDYTIGTLNRWSYIEKDTIWGDRQVWVERSLGDFTDEENLWMQLKFKKKGFFAAPHWVKLQVWNGGSWVDVDQFGIYEHQSPVITEDYGIHNGSYYDLTPYKNSNVKIRFLTGTDMAIGSTFRWTMVNVFSWGKDTDGDGLSDALELMIGTLVDDSDTDNDGVSDYDEVNFDGDASDYNPATDLNPFDADTDGDGADDATELFIGTDPLDGGDIPLPGDMNFDGLVNLADYLLLIRLVLGMTGSPPTPGELYAGDLNVNAELDAGDLVILVRTVLGII